MRIGVTMRVMAAAGYSEDRDALAQIWAPFLAVALPGALWLPVPNLGAAQVTDFCAGWGIDRLILSGGEDIGTVPRRDESELSLLAWAEARQIPVLGICRGMQLMGRRAGAALQPVTGHVATRHPLEADPNESVNSFHALALTGCPPGYRVLARAADGTIEAIRHLSLPWEGWMWHPEREAIPRRQDIDAMRSVFA